MEMENVISLFDALSNPVVAACAVYIAKSIHDLNTKIAVVIERVDSHEHRIGKIEDRI